MIGVLLFEVLTQVSCATRHRFGQTGDNVLGETMQLQFKIKYKCSMLVGRRYKLVTGMGKAFDLEF